MMFWYTSDGILVLCFVSSENIEGIILMHLAKKLVNIRKIYSVSTKNKHPLLLFTETAFCW